MNINPPNHHRICILGAGSWGTALAIHLARQGHHVVLWGHQPSAVHAMASTRTNATYLPNITFPDNLTLESDINHAVSSADGVLIVVPSHGFENIIKRLLPHQPRHVAYATKGFIEADPYPRLLHQVFPDTLVAQPAVLSGPTFAKEVAQGLPTAMVSAGNLDAATWWAQAFHAPHFRAYIQTDAIGVEVGGAVKNIIAIAAGMSDGLGFGANARAALIARGLAEMSRLGQALGGKMDTLTGLAGLGDLVLTCTDDQSRNRRFGLLLGQGQLNKQAAIDQIGQVVEGIHAAHKTQRLAQYLGVELPIVDQVTQVVNGTITAKQAGLALMQRDLKSE